MIGPDTKEWFKKLFKVEHPAHDEPLAWYWSILLVFAMILHLAYAVITKGIVVCIGASLGTMTVSIPLILVVRRLTLTRTYFNIKNVTIALYIGLILVQILESYAH
jgi:hypothetical protein